MRIGFSLGRCVRDIVKGDIGIDDVVVIITSTRIETAEQLKDVILSYMGRPNYLLGLDEDECQSIAGILWREGKFHQPRNFGAWPPIVDEIAVWGDLVPTGGFEDPMVKEAWSAYRSLLTLAVELTPKESVEWSWKR